MKGLFTVLPPFTPDYSGVCSVLFELGGIAAIYDAGGCTGNFTGYDEPRWFGSSSAIFSGELREIDAVFGDDEKFIQKLHDAARNLERSFVAILGSPAPMVMGTDYKALADIVEARTGLPALFFDTNGIEYYDRGISLALAALAKTFVRPPTRKEAKSVNIIGATPLDFGQGRQIGELQAFLKQAGFSVRATWAMGATLEDIAGSAEASLNLVISRSGLAAAHYLEQSLGMPYVVGIPVGRAPVASLLRQLRREGRKEGESLEERGAETALVIGEQVMCNAIRDCLEQDLGFGRVTVASYFTMDEALTRPGDLFLEEERDLLLLDRREKFDVVIGDPLYQGLLAEKNARLFVPVPHIALSSRLYWDYEYSLIGENGLRMLQQALGSRYKKPVALARQ
jgi:hypothetical protein